MGPEEIQAGQDPGDGRLAPPSSVPLGRIEHWVRRGRGGWKEGCLGPRLAPCSSQPSWGLLQSPRAWGGGSRATGVATRALSSPHAQGFGNCRQRRGHALSPCPSSLSMPLFSPLDPRISSFSFPPSLSAVFPSSSLVGWAVFSLLFPPDFLLPPPHFSCSLHPPAQSLLACLEAFSFLIPLFPSPLRVSVCLFPFLHVPWSRVSRLLFPPP